MTHHLITIIIVTVFRPSVAHDPEGWQKFDRLQKTIVVDIIINNIIFQPSISMITRDF